MIKTKRRMIDSIGYFNFARGFGIICVLFGHTIRYFVSTEIIYSGLFSNISTSVGAAIMAMFFMVSGFGFRSKKIKKAISEQAQMLLIPYVVTASLIVAAKLVLAILKQKSFIQNGGDILIAYLIAINGYKSTILGFTVDNIGILWFLWALFGGWIIYDAITRIGNSKIEYLLVSTGILISFLMIHYSKVWPFVLPHMFQTTGFICVGKLIRDSDFLEKKQNPLVYIILCVSAGITLTFGGVDINSCSWRLSVIDYIGIMCLGILILKGFSALQNRKVKGKLYNAVAILGVNTLYIFCIHGVEAKIIPWYRWTHYFDDRIWLGLFIYLLVRICFIFIAFNLVKFIQHKFFKKKKSKHKKISLQIDR